MQHEPAPAAGPSRGPLVGLLAILPVVLFWNGSYKGVRVANTLYVLELGAGPLESGLLLATYGVVPLVLAVYTGRLIDRYGVRVPVLLGTAISVLGVLLPYFWPVYAVLFLSAAVSGLGFILAQVSMQSLVGSLAGGAARARNINLYALTVSLSDLLGPVVAGFSIDHFGHVRAYLLLAVPAVFSALGVLLMMRGLPRAAPASDQGSQRLSDLFGLADLRRMFIASALVMCGLDLFQLYLPVYAHSVGLSASATGLVMGAFAAAAFVTRAALPVLARRYGEEPSLRYALFVAASTFFLIPLFRDAWVLAAVCFALGLGMGLGQPLTVILTYNYSPAGRHGESLGTRIAINNSMHVVVPALFGAAGSVLGLAPVFWVSSALLFAGGCAARARRSA